MPLCDAAQKMARLLGHGCGVIKRGGVFLVKTEHSDSVLLNAKQRVGLF